MPGQKQSSACGDLPQNYWRKDVKASSNSYSTNFSHQLLRITQSFDPVLATWNQFTKAKSNLNRQDVRSHKTLADSPVQNETQQTTHKTTNTSMSKLFQIIQLGHHMRRTPELTQPTHVYAKRDCTCKSSTNSLSHPCFTSTPVSNISQPFELPNSSG